MKRHIGSIQSAPLVSPPFMPLSLFFLGRFFPFFSFQISQAPGQLDGNTKETNLTSFPDHMVALNRVPVLQPTIKIYPGDLWSQKTGSSRWAPPPPPPPCGLPPWKEETQSSLHLYVFFQFIVVFTVCYIFYCVFCICKKDEVQCKMMDTINISPPPLLSQKKCFHQGYTTSS